LGAIDTIARARQQPGEIPALWSRIADSWAILAHLENRRPAAEHVAALLESERPVLSWINLGEVFHAVRRFEGEEAAASTVRDLRDVVDTELPDEPRIIEAARIKAERAMAYAGAFAAATAVVHDATLWAGDPELLVAEVPWRWRSLR
jgi:predicted nucleic acid-binding protein